MREMETYAIVFFRIITIMVLLLFSTLFIMGKRPIGELPVFDFLSIIVIGAIVGADIADPQIEHMPTVFAVIILSVFQKGVSKIIIKSKKIRRLITFDPTIVIQNGEMIYKNIKKIHYSIDEILMLLREKDIFDIRKIDFAIVEANGDVSILKKPQHDIITKTDMNLPHELSNLTLTVILDGVLDTKNIKILKKSVDDILQKLKEKGFDDYKDVFYASMDMQGNITTCPYNEQP